MSKTVIFYYTQTGQTREIAQSVCQPLADRGHTLVYKEIKALEDFPYPWGADGFFQAFPESREAIPCKLKDLDLSDVQDADLVVIVYQVWYLSPSIPFHAFFQLPTIQTYLRGKKIVTIDGCRNMWVMAHQKVKSYIYRAGGDWVGNIVLQDRHHNLVSVVTVIRWLIMGKKEKTGLFPKAGVSGEDICNASVFGSIIADSFEKFDFENLQKNLMNKGAIQYKPSIVFVEKTGHRIFGIWSKFILKKGGYGSPDRNRRLRVFKYYLLTIIYLISPIGLLFFYLTYPFRYLAIKKDKVRQCYLLKP